MERDTIQLLKGQNLEIDQSIIPRRWQIEAFKAWDKEFAGIARVVTGGGKTVFSFLCLKRFFSEYPHGKAIIVVPTIALLDQWFVDISDATDIDETEIACYSGSSKPEHPKRVNILVLNTARLVSQDLSNSGTTFLIVDECHRAGAVENSRALMGNHEATLGLSATPEREADDGFVTRITPALGPVIYDYDYRTAKTDGVIVDFDLMNIEIGFRAGDLNRLQSRLKNTKDTSEGRASVVLATSSGLKSTKITRSAERALRVPWAVKLALSHKRERVIVFHERVADVESIAELLASLGQNSVTYHSSLSDSHRRDNLRLFRRGIVNMLVTCRALDEGANVPEANIAIVAHSTSSTRQRIQRLGRVLRPARSKRRALVYTLYVGDDQRIRLSKEAANLEGVADVSWSRGTIH